MKENIYEVIKPKVAIIGHSVENLNRYAEQLENLFDEQLLVEKLTLKDIKEKSNYYADCLLLPTYSILNEIEPHVCKDVDILIFNRSISRNGFNSLKDLEPESTVLLIDETKEMANEIKVVLKQLGINHLRIEISETKTIDSCEGKIIITLKEHNEKKNAIMLETFIDINTLLEITVKLGLQTISEKKRFIKEFDDMISPKVGASWIFDKLNVTEARLSLISEPYRNGYLEINAFGEIEKANNKFLELFGVNIDELRSGTFRKIFSDDVYNKVFLKKKIVENELIKAETRDIVVDIYPIERLGEFYGASVLAKDFGIAEKKQHEIRMKIVGKGHCAKYNFNHIRGTSDVIKECIQDAKRMAASDSAILIEGETGTGKELFAQAIHNESPRKNYPFVAVNCGALPESILESELFGYEEGAFTGARKGGKIGLFELAHSGTIFLDEIGEMPLNLQTKLLRVLQEKEIMKLGSDNVISIDTRVIAATNKDLFNLIELGKFREDLYYRIRVLPLHLTPLRQRKEDIMPLIEHYQSELGGRFILDKGAKKMLVHHQWRGNAREVRNVVEFCVNKKKHNIFSSDLPFDIQSRSENGVSNNFEKETSGESLNEQTLILQELRKSFVKNERVGRRGIYKRIIDKGYFISEQRIRKCILELETNGYVRIIKGRGGTIITKKGMEWLEKNRS